MGDVMPIPEGLIDPTDSWAGARSVRTSSPRGARAARS